MINMIQNPKISGMKGIGPSTGILGSMIPATLHVVIGLASNLRLAPMVKSSLDQIESIFIHLITFQIVIIMFHLCIVLEENPKKTKVTLKMDEKLCPINTFLMDNCKMGSHLYFLID